jgi:hypothetical protein
MRHFANRATGALLVSAIIFCALLSGCSAHNGSHEYLVGLQTAAMNGSVSQSDIAAASEQCPKCTPDELAFAQRIVAAEHGMNEVCAGLPTAETNYRQIRMLIGAGDVPVAPGYQEFVNNRMCIAADHYATCTDPAARHLSPGDPANPAGNLLGAISECRASNPDAAAEVVNRVLSQEAQAISNGLLSGDFKQADHEVRIYAAMPRANQGRVEQWRDSITEGEHGRRVALRRASARAKQMVCQPSVRYVDTNEKGEAMQVSMPGLNLHKTRHTDEDGDEEAVQSTPDQKMNDLVALLANETNLSLADSRRILTSSYDLALKDPGSFCTN